MVAHHGKGCRVGAGDGDGCAQGRGCEEVNQEAGISGGVGITESRLILLLDIAWATALLHSVAAYEEPT